MIPEVALWFAKNSKGEIKTIDEIQYHDDKYYCPLCGSEVIPKAIKEDSKVTAHFAHLDRSKCTPESMIHWWYKNKFIQSGDKFIVTTDKMHTYVCKDILIEQIYHTKYGDYKPDVTIFTESGETIYFEYAFTNKKKVKDYLDKWLALGNIVVEVDLKTLLQANYGKDIYNFRALFYKGKCFNTNKCDLYYKTIGKYKEQAYANKIVDNKKKKEIEKLDWFWNSVQEYKIGKLTNEELYLCFNEAFEIDCNLVKDILIKSRCTDILDKCIAHKRKQNNTDFVNKINKIIKKYNGKIIVEMNTYGFEIYSTLLGGTHSYDFNKRKNMRHIGGISYCSDLHIFNEKDIKYVRKQIAVELNEVRDYKHYQKTLKNKSLWKAVDLINQYVKTINPLYEFLFEKDNKYKISFGLYFRGGYTNGPRLTFDLTHTCVNSTSFNDIYLYFKSKIDNYRKDFILFDNRLYDILKNICDFYNNLNNNLSCKIMQEAENNIMLSMEKKNNYLFQFQFCITDNIFDNWIINEYGKEKYITYNTLNYSIEDLIKIIKNIISTKIRCINVYGY
mgnify:FL=1